MIERKTNETDIKLTLELDGTGTNAIDTDCGFLNHMLTLFAAHSRMNLVITCRGDSDVDFHHTVEDIAICLGAAIDEALGDKRGICRYGSCTLPMDEALVSVFLDFSGRGHLEENLNISQNKVGDFDTELCKEFLLAIARSYGSCTLPMDEALVSVFLDFSGRGHLEENLNISQNKVGDFDTELCKEFLLAIARSAKMTLHVVQERGKNAHHIIEAVFKAMARAMREAVTIDQKFRNEIPSTKGVI